MSNTNNIIQQLQKEVQELTDSNLATVREVFWDETYGAISDDIEDPDSVDLVFAKIKPNDAINTSETMINRIAIEIETKELTPKEIETILNELPRFYSWAGYADGFAIFYCTTFKGLRGHLIPKEGYVGPVEELPTQKDKDLPDGWSSFLLDNKNQLKTEGRLQKHCLGKNDMGYVAGIENKTITLFSIRNPNGQPVLTVEIKDNAIVQMKGDHNRLPGFGRSGTKVTRPGEIKAAISFCEKHGIKPESVSDLKPGLRR